MRAAALAQGAQRSSIDPPQGCGEEMQMDTESVSRPGAPLVAPFPYFGGKRRIAAEVWRRFGNVRSYVEPFFGSGAVLLGRPTPFDGVETVNDLDGLLCNFWRAVRADPAAVAEAADWPVSECDQIARHAWLVERREGITEALCADPEWFDARAAGWWVWGMSAIGIARGRFTARGSPGCANLGPPQGVISLRKSGGLGRLVDSLSWRFGDVRVRCGDWRRMVQSDTSIGVPWGMAAVFLDPPYDTGAMDYAAGGMGRGIAAAVRAWALDAGKRPDIRIALCGYDEHDDLERAGWSAYRWSTGDHVAKGGPSKGNGHREVVWFSPACIAAQQMRLL